MFLLQEGNRPVLINPTGLAVLERNFGLWAIVTKFTIYIGHLLRGQVKLVHSGEELIV